MASLPDEPQPDARPIAPPVDHPSLWLYTALLLLAVGLISIAFALQRQPDWPGLFLNLAAGLVGSVVILTFVDQRLRGRELAALRRFPTRTTQRFSALVFPTNRIGLRYTRRLLITLQPLIEGKLERAQFAALEAKTRTGFVLRVGPGEGKTTWIQMVAANLARQYLLGLPGGRIPIIFSLARWSPDRTLDDALYENLISYAICRRWVFDRLLRSGHTVVLLDGYDELWKTELPLNSEVHRLRAKFPNVAWTLTSHTLLPTPTDFGETVNLSPPTEEEMTAIQRRHGR